MRSRASGLLPFAFVALFVPLAACATYEQALERSEDHFQHDEYEKALANLRALEPEWTSFGTRDQARYCYLRGMTDARLGFPSDARHWLAVAQEIDKEHPGALLDKERQSLDDHLGKLNAVIWAGDVLPIDEPPGARASKKVETTTSEDKADEKKGGDGGEVTPPKTQTEPTDDGTTKPKSKKKPSKSEE